MAPNLCDVQVMSVGSHTLFVITWRPWHRTNT